MTLIIYILISSVFLSIFYLAYKLIYRNETNFRQLRLYLLGSILLSLLVPFNNYTIETGKRNKYIIPRYEITGAVTTSDQQVPAQAKPAVNWPSVAVKLYLLVGLSLLLRIGWQILILVFQYIKSDKIVHKDCVILVNHRFRNNFSFFGWIFITRDSASTEDLEQIIAHEKIHALQYHSFDLIVMELLTAVMWFNPLIWNLKNTIQLVHEYLADEGALNTGIDRFRYQSLLINQITEEKLIRLSSSFNHALIKKRMKMMTKSRITRRSQFKFLALVPLSTTLFFMMACINGLFPENLKAGSVSGSPVYSEYDRSIQLGSVYPVPVQDTIKKKTIVKIISKGGKHDTITYLQIIVPDDTSSTAKVIRMHKPGNNQDVRKLLYISEDDEIEIPEGFDHDSIKVIKIIKTGKDIDVGKDVVWDKKVDEEKKVEIITTRKSEDLQWESKDKETSNVLVIIDGIKHTEKNALSAVDPDKIERVDVIKDKKLIKKYTEKEYDGVIVVTTKAGKTDSDKK